jgi:hypothetical protein
VRDPARREIETFRDSTDAEVCLTVKRSIRTAAGVVLLVVGAAGLVLPLLPGIPLIIAGLALLGTDHPLRVAITRRLERWRVMRRSRHSPPPEARR